VTYSGQQLTRKPQLQVSDEPDDIERPEGHS
jgi:hypothetical protein